MSNSANMYRRVEIEEALFGKGLVYVQLHRGGFGRCGLRSKMVSHDTVFHQGLCCTFSHPSHTDLTCHTYFSAHCDV